MTLRYITTEVIKKAEPIKQLTVKVMSPPSPPLPADIAAKTSGAPLPRARRVTPANDSEHENFSEMASKAGERY